MTFTRADREWWFSPRTNHVIYGEITWREVNGSLVGSLPYHDADLHPLQPVVLFLIKARMKYAPTMLVKLGETCLARVDVNGVHNFPDGLRESTHLQIYATGNDRTPTTTELLDFPDVPASYEVEFDQQMWHAMYESAPYLNLDLHGLDRRSPIPHFPEGRRI